MKFWRKINTFIKTKKNPPTSPHCLPKSQFIKMKPGSLTYIYFNAINSNFVPKSLRHIQGKTHFGLSQQNPKCMNDVNRQREVDS